MIEESTREVICKGCDQMKTVPMILLEEHTYTEGLCPECVEDYGMQVGDKVRLRRPNEYGESEVMFAGPEANAKIRVRSYRGGLTIVARPPKPSADREIQLCQELDQTRSALAERDASLQAIYQSRPWRVVTQWWRLKRRLSGALSH